MKETFENGAPQPDKPGEERISRVMTVVRNQIFIRDVANMAVGGLAHVSVGLLKPVLTLLFRNSPN